MTNRAKILIFVPILILSLSCQTVMHVLEPISTATHQPPNTSVPIIPITDSHQDIISSSTITPIPTVQITPRPSPFPSKTLTSTPAPENTLSKLQSEIFEEIWQIINNDYLYPDFNGLDWDAIHEEYLQRIQSGISDNDFYLTMDEMIARLGDEHSLFLNPEDAAKEDSQYAGNYDYVGIGIIASPITEKGQAVIILTFPNSPADIAGLQSHDIILAVNGEKILDDDGYIRDIIRGPEGTNLILTVQTPGGTPRQVETSRRRITGAIPVPYQILSSPNGQKIGYIMLATLGDSTTGDQVRNALREMSNNKPLDGLIIDNRQNEGGADTVLIQTLSYFTEGTLGFFTSRHEERPLQVDGLDLFGSQEIPLVVLIGTETVSYGEVMSGVLKDNGRAYLIGETTEGNVETLWGYDFPDGSRAWIAHESFQPFNHPEEDWEAHGIVPHLTILTNWDEITIDNDPALSAALSFLDDN